MSKEKKTSYYELLRHPKWQEKRLRIMERAGFECENCGDNESILNVHHTYYERGLNPWEYPDETLRCLCDPCHGEADELRIKVLRQLGLLTDAQLLQVLGFSIGLRMEDGSIRESPEEEGYELVLGMVRVFLTLSGHQTSPATDAIAWRCGRTGAVTSDDLFSACECDRLASAAKPIPFELVP